jgi:hypothetical protein
MPSKRTTGKFEFTVDHENNRYKLYRKVTGTKNGKRQKIFLSDYFNEQDQAYYSKETEMTMELIAKNIGLSLIRSYLLQVQGCLSSPSQS